MIRNYKTLKTGGVLHLSSECEVSYCSVSFNSSQVKSIIFI